MQRLLCFIFLITFGGSEAYDHYDSSHHHDSIVKPCSTHDWKCIREFFAHTFGCTPVYGSAPDPYFTRTADLNIAHANVTSRRHDFQISGLNSGTIQEFYINKETDTLVLEVEFEELVTYSPKVVISYLRKGKEPIRTTDAGKLKHRNLSLTLTIQHYSDSKHADSHVFVYFSDVPEAQYGPGIVYPRVKGLTPDRLKWLRDFELSAKEGMVSQGPVFMRAFLRTKLCKFEN